MQPLPRGWRTEGCGWSLAGPSSGASYLGASFLLLVVAALLATGGPSSDDVVDVGTFRLEHRRQHPPCLGRANDDDPPHVASEGDWIAVTGFLDLINRHVVTGNVGNVAWVSEETADMEHSHRKCNAMRYKIKASSEAIG